MADKETFVAGAGKVFGGFDIGIGNIGNAFLIIFVAIFIIGLVALLIYMVQNKKAYKHIIPVYKKIGNNVIRVAIFRAKDYKIGNAGDMLWFVAKAKKFIPPATIQTAPREYSHFEREDGEWINIAMPDIDLDLKKFGVKYVHQDMRANRIAISNLLEQRFTKKSFWDKWGNLIMNIIMYLVIAIAMVVIFWEWSGIVEKTGLLIDKLDAVLNANNIVPTVPAFAPLLFLRRKK